MHVYGIVPLGRRLAVLQYLRDMQPLLHVHRMWQHDTMLRREIRDAVAGGGEAAGKVRCRS